MELVSLSPAMKVGIMKSSAGSLSHNLAASLSVVDHVLVGEEDQADVGHHVHQVRAQPLVHAGHALVPATSRRSHSCYNSIFDRWIDRLIDR